MLRHQTKLMIRPRTWVLTWLAVLVGGLGAALFYHVSKGFRQAVETSPNAPSVRLGLGADLWTLADSSLLDHTPRRFPYYSVETLESRRVLDPVGASFPEDIVVLAPAERFLAEEFIRESSSLPQLIITPGPILRKTGLALVLSRDTEAEILRSTGSPPHTLLDWVQACAVSSRPGHPISFCMADPDYCSASWLGLAELISETLGNLGAKQLQSVTDAQMASAVGQLQAKIKVSGTSDRLEMYKLLLGEYPEGTVYLVYDHLAAPLPGRNSKDLTVVYPDKHFDPIVQTIIVSKIPKSQLHLYLPSLLKSWAGIRLAQPNTSAVRDESTGINISRVPNYITMERILDAWNSGRVASSEK